MEPKDVTEQVLVQIAELSVWISSLSLAIIGGLVAAFLQIAFHNASKPDHQIALRSPRLLTIALFVEAFAILAGYIARASLLTRVAHFQSLELTPNTDLGRQGLGFILFTQYATLVQFVLFMSGVFLIGFFIFKNQKLILTEDACDEVD